MQGTNGKEIPPPPSGFSRLVWLGPGFLWMVSAAGSGELLFTPRIAAQYGYSLLWAMLAAVTLKWFINREIGRLAVCTGVPVLDGYKKLGNWALWVILVPQLVVAAASIAGLAASAATALILFLPGDVRLWMIVSILSSTALVVWGKYKKVEATARILAVVLAIASIAAAVAVFPTFSELAAGLVPRLPPDVQYVEILPWLGYMLSGAAGMMWYSYWITSKGYGAAHLQRENNEPANLQELSPEQRSRLKGWLTQMTLDTSVAVIGALIITLAFLILGAELLRPRGLVPEEEQVAATLGILLGGVFGVFGFWFMIIAVFIGFWDTVLSDQDGFGRLFAGGTRILARSFGLAGRWTDDEFLRKAFVIVLVTIVPIALYLMIGNPVTLLKMAGAIEAAHIPVITFLTLFLNHKLLPAEMRPSLPVIIVTGSAGLFFAAFAVFYLVQSFGL
jgi:Mn2+/Fe2+ NRAMP family transporter